MANLILLRHGKSVWNELNLFTGWVDVPLAADGVREAQEAGAKIKNFPIDIIFTSTLVRAQMTAMIALVNHAQKKVPILQHQGDGDGERKMKDWGKIYGDRQDFIPVLTNWALNERMYGELQGLNKEETMKKFGKEQVHLWRRSYDVAPPGGESLKDTAARCLPFFQKEILPCLEKGKNVLVSAHGNSLRSIIMQLDHLSEDEVVNLELPTGVPVLYSYDGKGKNFHKSSLLGGMP